MASSIPLLLAADRLQQPRRRLVCGAGARAEEELGTRAVLVHAGDLHVLDLRVRLQLLHDVHVCGLARNLTVDVERLQGGGGGVHVVRVDDDEERRIDARAEGLLHEVGGLALRGLLVRHSVDRQRELEVEHRRGEKPQ